MVYTINQLAKLAGVSVRTLHYYDEIGLLKPAFTRSNGYRCYAEKEVLKLQQILFFRELDFPLEQITRLLTSAEVDTIHLLEDQKTLLRLKKQRLEHLLETITERITTQKRGDSMKQDDLFGSFTTDRIEQYKEEAKQRWGHTDAYKQSVERTKHFTKADYQRIAAEGKALTQAIADAMPHGVESDAVQALIVKHYQSIQLFYDCSYAFYQNLGEMYVADERFSATYEAFAPGLAQFMRDAIVYFVAHQTR